MCPHRNTDKARTAGTDFPKLHYGATDLMERVDNALRLAGHDPTNLTAESLNTIDQLHSGGLSATKALAEVAGLRQGMRVLDAGCGIGGSSRYLALTYACQVDAMDLTPECVSIAASLNKACKHDDRITVRQGSVDDLPYANLSFDVVWSQSVAMNVKDKRRMFSEAFRVLVPGGRLALSHAAQGPAGEPYYPLPWAMDSSCSFLATPEEIDKTLEETGFNNILVRAEAGRSGGSQSTVMGSDMPDRQANAARSLREGRLIRMLVVADRTP
jgi:ubiquinone/menaquinone biosynthesis C-methylase UbiE